MVMKGSEVIFNSVMCCSKGAVLLEIDGAARYYRWLSYTPDFLSDALENLCEKSDDQLSLKELKVKREYVEEKCIVGQLRAYFNRNINGFRYSDIVKYFNSHPLDEIRHKKLTEDEMKLAFEKSKEIDCDLFRGNFAIDDNTAILKYSPDSMVDFFAMEIYSNYLVRLASSGLRCTMEDSIRKNNSARSRSYIKIANHDY